MKQNVSSKLPVLWGDVLTGTPDAFDLGELDIRSSQQIMNTFLKNQLRSLPWNEKPFNFASIPVHFSMNQASIEASIKRQISLKQASIEQALREAIYARLCSSAGRIEKGEVLLAIGNENSFGMVEYQF